MALLYIKIGAKDKARKLLLDQIETGRKRLELHPDNFRMLTWQIKRYAGLRDKEMLWREERKLLDLTETGPLGEIALAHLEIDEAERAFETHMKPVLDSAAYVGELFRLDYEEAVVIIHDHSQMDWR